MQQQNNQAPKIVWSGGEFRTKCVVGVGRDGVLNEDLEPYCWRPDDLKPIPGSMEAMAEMRRKGYKIVVITDQGGIEKGMFKMEDVDATNEQLMKYLGEAGCFSIDALYYSASSRKEDIYAKPNVGMFKRCEKEHKDIKFKGGYYVGHTIKDLKAAVNIGAKPVLVRTGKGAETEKELNKFTYRNIKSRVLVFDNLAAFVASLN